MSSWKNNTVFIWINSFIDFKKILSILYLPRYICNWLQFQKSSAVKIKFRNLYPRGSTSQDFPKRFGALFIILYIYKIII